MTKQATSRIAGIGERIHVRLTLIEEALGMTPADPEVYSKFIASKAPESDLTQEEAEAVKGMEQPEDQATVFPRTEDGAPFCWDYQIKGFFKDACSSLRRVPGTRSSKLTAFKKVIDGTIFVGPRVIPFELPEGAVCGRCERPLRASTAMGERRPRFRGAGDEPQGRRDRPRMAGLRPAPWPLPMAQFRQGPFLVGGG